MDRALAISLWLIVHLYDCNENVCGAVLYVCMILPCQKPDVKFVHQVIALLLDTVWLDARIHVSCLHELT